MAWDWNPISKDNDYGAFQGGGTVRRAWRKTFGSNDGPASTEASDTYAALTREQWNSYVSTFVPIENQLIDYATDKNRPGMAMAEASQDVNDAYAAAAGATDRRLRGMGVTLSGDEQQAQQRSFGLSKSLADVGAQNTAGALTRERQASLLGNPAPAVTSGVQGG